MNAYESEAFFHTVFKAIYTLPPLAPRIARALRLGRASRCLLPHSALVPTSSAEAQQRGHCIVDLARH